MYRPYSSEWFFAKHASDPLVFVLQVPPDFRLSKVEVTQVRGTLAGFAADVHNQDPATLVGYENNGDTLVEAEAILATKLGTITVAAAASKGSLAVDEPIRNRDVTGMMADPSSIYVKVTVTTPGTTKLIAVRYYGLIGSQ